MKFGIIPIEGPRLTQKLQGKKNFEERQILS